MRCPNCLSEKVAKKESRKSRGGEEYQQYRCKNKECDTKAFMGEMLRDADGNAVEALRYHPRYFDQLEDAGHILEKPDPTGRFVEDGNEASMIATQAVEPPTLGDVIAQQGIDLGEWELVKRDVSYWTTPIKLRRSEGKGIAHDVGLQVTNWRVMFKFVRREPVRVAFDHIRPVVIRSSAAPKRMTDRPVKYAVISSDYQIGFRWDERRRRLVEFVDRRAVDVMLQVCRYLTEETGALARKLIAGDYLDMTEFSDKFEQKPEFARTTQPALEEAAWLGARIVETCGPGCQVDLVQGNHEDRMHRAGINNLSAAHGIKPPNRPEALPWNSLDRWLGFDRIGIKVHGRYKESEPIYLNSNLTVSHGNLLSSTPGGTASKLAKANDVGVICGHAHRTELVTLTRRTGKAWNGNVSDSRRTRQGIVCGCLCRVDGVVPGQHPDANWNQSFVVVEYDDEDAHLYQATQVMIYGGQATFAGRRWVGQDYTEELCRDLDTDVFAKEAA